MHLCITKSTFETANSETKQQPGQETSSVRGTDLAENSFEQ